MNPIRTLIIDDEKPACERLKKLLSSFEEIRLIDAFTNSQEGLKSILKQKPDLVFLDVELENNLSAFDLMRQLDDNYLHPHIILVTAYPHYSIKAIKNEVFDYLLKPVDIDELKTTIGRFKNHISLNPDHIIEDLNMLSTRESEVLRLVLDGKSSSEIAKQLYLSINTVNTHRRNILKKTGARFIVDLLRKKRNFHA
jgi:DNA-binding NarL/FixJ family response regulator